MNAETTTEVLDATTNTGKPIESLPGYLDGEFIRFRQQILWYASARYNALLKQMDTGTYSHRTGVAFRKFESEKERYATIADERYRKLLADTHTSKFDRDTTRISNRTLKALIRRYEQAYQGDVNALAFALEATRNNFGAEHSPTTVHFDDSTVLHDDWSTQHTGGHTSFSCAMLNPPVISQAVTAFSKKGVGNDRGGWDNLPFKGVKVAVQGSTVTVTAHARLSADNYRNLVKFMRGLSIILDGESLASDDDASRL